MAIVHVEVDAATRAEVDRLLEHMALVQRIEEAATASQYQNILNLLEGRSTADLLTNPELGMLHAWALYFVKGWDASLLAFTEHIWERSAREGDELTQARVGNLLAGLYFHMGDMPTAERIFRETILLAARTGRVQAESGAWSGLGMVTDMTGRLDDARACYDRCIALIPPHGQLVHRGAMYQNRGLNLVASGRPVEAQESFRLAAGNFTAAGADIPWALSMAGLARATSETGDQPAAEAIIHRIRASSGAESRPPGVLAEIDWVSGIVYTRQGRLDEANTALQRALDTARAAGDRLLVAEVLESQGDLADAREDLVTARERYLASEAVYLELPSEWRAARVRRLADALE